MNLIKNGLTDIFLYGCGLVIVNGLSFLMLPFYTRQFSPSDYAFITLVLTCLPLTRSTLPVEISQAVVLFSHDHKQKGPEFISTGFWFTILINISCYSGIFIANLIFNFVPFSFFWLLSIFILLTIDSLFYYSTNILRWTLKSFTYNLIISAVAILEVCLTLIFVLYFKFSIISVFYSWLIARFLGFSIILLLTKEYYLLIFKLAKLKSMLSFSFPLMLSNIANNINRSFDRWIIGIMIGGAAVGIYGAGATFGGITSLVVATMSSALTPLIYKNHSQPNAPFYIAKLFYAMVTFCLLIAICITLFNAEILNFILGQAFRAELIQQPIVPIVILTSILSGMYIFSPGIYIHKKSRLIIWFNLCSLITNIILCLLIIKRFGILGVAVSTCISTLISAFLYMIFSQKYYQLPFKFWQIFIFIFLVVLFYSGGVWLGINYMLLNNSIMIRCSYLVSCIVILCSLVWYISSRMTYETNDDLRTADELVNESLSKT